MAFPGRWTNPGLQARPKGQVFHENRPVCSGGASAAFFHWLPSSGNSALALGASRFRTWLSVPARQQKRPQNSHPQRACPRSVQCNGAAWPSNARESARHRVPAFLLNPRSGSIAYVLLPGSLKKREALVVNGITAEGRKTTACTVCHGADLRGFSLYLQAELGFRRDQSHAL